MASRNEGLQVPAVPAPDVEDPRSSGQSVEEIEDLGPRPCSGPREGIGDSLVDRANICLRLHRDRNAAAREEPSRLDGRAVRLPEDPGTDRIEAGEGRRGVAAGPGPLRGGG